MGKDTFSIVPTSAIRWIHLLDFLLIVNDFTYYFFKKNIYLCIFSWYFPILIVPVFWTWINSGEGIPDLLLLLVQWTQKTMVERLTYSNEVQVCFPHISALSCLNILNVQFWMFSPIWQCTVLEVKVIEGHGTTIDVVLVNGVLHEGDQIVVCGMQVELILYLVCSGKWLPCLMFPV